MDVDADLSENSDDETVNGIISYPDGEIITQEEILTEVQGELDREESDQVVAATHSISPSPSPSPTSLLRNSVHEQIYEPDNLELSPNLSNPTSSPSHSESSSLKILPPMSSYKNNEWSSSDTLRMHYSFDDSEAGPVNPPV